MLNFEYVRLAIILQRTPSFGLLSAFQVCTAVRRSVVRIDWLLDILFKVLLALACELSMYFHICGGWVLLVWKTSGGHPTERVCQ